MVQLDGFLKDVDTIPQRLSNFSSNISSLSAWMLNLKNQPLEIDYLRIQSEDVAVPKANAGFFQTLSYMAKQFAGSFVMDYNSIGDTTGRGRGPRCVDWPRADPCADHQGAGG